jgi:CBS domain-containing protein
MKSKNYTGRQGESKKDEKPNLVRDYMARNLITFAPKQSVLEVMQLLLKHRISGGPVVNENNELLGMISEGDCMKQISESRYYNIPMADALVEKFMITNVETVTDDISIFDAANKFYTTRRKRFPVIGDGKLIGQISRRDVLKAALEAEANHW